MKITQNKKISKLSSILINISCTLIPIFQYIPCTMVWRGIMSVPFIIYLAFFFQNPMILKQDIHFLFSTNGIYFVLVGFILFSYSLIYQLNHRNQLLQNGPYKYVRHPQYIALILITFGLTLSVFQTYPIEYFFIQNINSHTTILFIWIGESLSYILLAKIEEFALKSKYGYEFLVYVDNVPFMFPFLNLKRNKTEKENLSLDKEE